MNVYHSLSFENLLSTFQLDVCVGVLLMTCSCTDADSNSRDKLRLFCKNGKMETDENNE